MDKFEINEINKNLTVNTFKGLVIDVFSTQKILEKKSWKQF